MLWGRPSLFPSFFVVRRQEKLLVIFDQTEAHTIEPAVSSQNILINFFIGKEEYHGFGTAKI